ncbi:MAG: tetratricopeptide repeat protein [Waddliaceae bacterium]
MGRINWLEQLGWTQEQLEDLRLAGFAYIRQGKYDIALPIFEALVVLDPDSAYDVQTLGALHLQLGHPEKALKSLDRALTLEADHTPTLLNFTKALFMLGRRHEGLKLAEILAREPNPTISNTAKALLLAYG